MRKLLNTVYVTNEMAYLTLDGENLVCKIDGEIKRRNKGECFPAGGADR